MAEANAATRFTGDSARGVQLAYDREGLHFNFSITVPPLGKSALLVQRSIRRSVLAFKDALFPNTLPVFVAVVASVVARVMTAESGSWWRSGWLAQAIWFVSDFFPWFQLPALVRVGILATWAAVLGFIVLASIQRLVLQQLLSFKGFLYLQHGKPVPLYIKAWFFVTRLLVGAGPRMYSFQSALPPLPVPPLQQTTETFLKYARALHGAGSDKFLELQKQADTFMKVEGPRLQRYLHFKWLVSPNYMTDWWEQYVYLMGRDPIMINSNYYALDPGRVVSTPVQTARAASVTHCFLRFHMAVEDEAIEPVLIQKTVPLCMWQYKRMFSTTRVPGRDMDRLVHYESSESRHAAVLCCGLVYSMPLYKADGSILSMSELEQSYAEIKIDAMDARDNGEVDAAEAAIPALTAWNRTRWAETREMYFSDGINRASLHTIETAMFVVALDEKECPILDWSQRGRDLIAGDGCNRWFDKSVTMVVQANGKVGVNCEHSWADAPVTAHLMEVSMVIGDHITDCYDANGFVKLPQGVARSPAVELAHKRSNPKYTKSAVDLTEKPTLRMKNAEPYFRDYFGPNFNDANKASFVCGASDLCARGAESSWRRLRWALPRAAEEAIAEAKEAAQLLIADLDLRVVTHTKYGKRFMKKCGVSPDAYTQMALQLAYHRDQGKFANTYEASMTRLFRRGRTETVRPVSQPAVDFVKAMGDGKVTASEKLALLQAAAKEHVQAYTDCMAGKGIDRHMFALYVVSKGKAIDSPFLKSALSEPWTLSTSQQPQQQTAMWDLKDPKWAKYISPGGGFGPVANDGYGVSYMQAGEDEMFFHISSKRSAENTDSSRFEQQLFKALEDMHDVLSSAL